MTGLLSELPRNLRVLVVLLCLTASPLLAKRNDDRVVLENGDHITGEIKKIERGTLFFKPGYALVDIQIDWTRVERLESEDDFTVGLTNGSVYTGLIKKISSSDQRKNDFTISTADRVVECTRAEVVTLQSMEKSRWNQMTGSIDYGFSGNCGCSAGGYSPGPQKYCHPTAKDWKSAPIVVYAPVA
jgi:hypothetical protein